LMMVFGKTVGTEIWVALVAMPTVINGLRKPKG
jgi:hypothetical protein